MKRVGNNRYQALVRSSYFWSAIVLLQLGACSGGGGGGGGADGRTTDTAVRLIHASIDAVPFSLSVIQDGVSTAIQTARYAQSTSYVPVAEGNQLITLERANTPGAVVASFPTQLKEETEYTFFVLGEERRGNFRTTLIEDLVSRPEEGFSLVQVLNGFDDDSAITVSVAGASQGPIGLGGSSGFFELPIGPQTFVISTVGGGERARVTVDLADRGETTILLSGSADLNVNFVTLYSDLD